LRVRSCPISKTTAFRSPSSERGVSRGSHPRSVLPETTNTNKHPGGSYTRQLSTRSGQSGHAAWKDWGGTLNLHTRQLRAQRPIGTRCAGDCGGLMSACFCRHFWPAIFAWQFLPAFWPAFSPAGPTRGPWKILRAFRPFKRGGVSTYHSYTLRPTPTYSYNPISVCRQTLLGSTLEGEP
jgi:hypothetical protein